MVQPAVLSCHCQFSDDLFVYRVKKARNMECGTRHSFPSYVGAMSYFR